ncbi:MAG: glycosyltransferase family 4 protein [Phycisphaerales bacterium]
MPLKILHISTRLILGGSQENTVLSCEGQARLGHEVHLAFGPIFGPEGSMLERVQNYRTDDGRGIKTHELPNMVREVNPFKDHFCFHRDLKNLMRDVQPDVVHTHSSKAGILGRWAAWKFGANNGNRPAIVHTIHGPPFMPIEGDAVSRAKIRVKNKIYEVAEKFAAKRCHTIVSVADAMTEQFLARGIGTPELYTTVRSGMEIGPYLNPRPGETRKEIRGELGLSESDFVIGTVARLAQHKGHDDILDALADDLRSHPDWKLLWVGDGWWRDRLLAKASDLGVRAQLVATGLVEPERVPGMIRAMDVLAHPSYREGLPRTVPQALLTGVCPVAYDSDGTREACRHEETGLLVEKGDIKGLRDSVKRLYDDSELRTRLAEYGRDWCKEEFAAETMVARLESVYRGAMVLAGNAGCAG